MNQLRAKFFKNQINIDILVLIYLLTLGLLIQLPTFLKVIQSTDESTFILMGQSILDGHLPYTELWDIKPPLAFFFFAAVITVFGKSIVNELALRIIQGKPITYGIPYKIKEYLRQENYNGEPIFLINHHLVYWLVNFKPMSKSTTQPYNITNDKLLPYMTKKMLQQKVN